VVSYSLGHNVTPSDNDRRELQVFKIYSSITLHVVLYGCKTWSLTLKEEHRLRVFENRMFRRIFGPRIDEVTEECRNLHNEEVNDCTPHLILFGS
jgi:hypothetical protein